MRTAGGLVAGAGKLLYLRERARVCLRRHPEVWTWLLSLLAWALLIGKLFTVSYMPGYAGPAIYCMPSGTLRVDGETTAEWLWSSISGGLVHWMIMIVAMMFPLLNEPVRHVAFSLRQKDRVWGIGWFLAGYSLIWIASGVLFMLLSLLQDKIADGAAPVVHGFIRLSGFLLAAMLVWRASRPVSMAKCSRTMPIRIQGWGLHADSLHYGLKTGIACLVMCWGSMLALVLAHHHLVLMYIVTIVLIYERYLVPHTSKLAGYAWAATGITLLALDLYAG